MPLPWWYAMRSDWKRPSLLPMNEGERRIKLTLSYDGKSFSGWQSQVNGKGVQQFIERALFEITKTEVKVFGSGRTDSGVHALEQVCHFDTKSNMSLDNFVNALNSKLLPSIRIHKAEEKDGSFHSRFTTMAREYKYFVKGIDDFLPFDQGYVTKIRKLPSLALLNSYAKCILGTHDFTTFASARDSSESKARDIYESEWNEAVDKYQKRYYCYRIVGNAFLYHQIRSLVGTMLLAALNDEPVASFDDRLKAKDRNMALYTAPSDGLYLSRISYDEDEYLWFEEQSGKQ